MRGGAQTVAGASPRGATPKGCPTDSALTCHHFGAFACYYRLSVFPIHVPSLREDIPELALHFLDAASKRFGLPPATLKQRHVGELQAYGWPGNIRELQNVIERAVITSQGRDLEFKLHATAATGGPAPPIPSLSNASQFGTPILTDREVRAFERENIIRALEHTDWKVGGEAGAAALLGIKPTTLASRIRVMKITRNNAGR